MVSQNIAIPVRLNMVAVDPSELVVGVVARDGLPDGDGLPASGLGDRSYFASPARRLMEAAMMTVPKGKDSHA